MALTLGPCLAVGRTAEVFEFGDGRVVKLLNANRSQNAIEYEINVARIVDQANLAAPKMHEVVHLDGRTGIVFERVDGRSMLDAMARQPWALARFARQFAELHAAMHAVTCADLPSQREQLTRMIRSAARLSDETQSRVLAQLERLSDDNAVCHGDLHPDNVILSARGPIVIDWITATRGSPLADVARSIVLMRAAALLPHMGVWKRILIGVARDAFRSTYEVEYCRRRGIARDSIAPWIAPIAAARLSEGISEEYDALVGLVGGR